MTTPKDTVALSAEDIERLSSDSDGGPAQRLGGIAGVATNTVAFFLAAFALYWTQFSVNTTVYRASFLGIVLGLIFVLYPQVPKSSKPRWPSIEEACTAFIGIAAMVWIAVDGNIFARDTTSGIIIGLIILMFSGIALVPAIPVLTKNRLLDFSFSILAIIVSIYIILNIEDYKSRTTRPTPYEMAIGGGFILLILEATRRTVGWTLSTIAVLFILYCYFGPWIPEPFDHRGFTLQRIIGQNLLTFEGIYSTPIDVAATFIILFTIYGAILDRGGAGRFFIDWAFALFGQRPSRSAPGRAVVASGFLLGTVSGSGVATTVTLASLAWPMLKRSGYPANIAGGMLSAAGIGATISPPTLGAAAFIIAEYLNVEYIQILAYSLIPTILYYISCWLVMEADAYKFKVNPVQTINMTLRDLTISQGYHFISLGAIAIFLVLNFSSFMAVFLSIAVAFVLSMIRPESRLVSIPAFFAGCFVFLATFLYGQSGLAEAHGLGDLFDGRLPPSLFWGMAAATLWSAVTAWHQGTTADNGEEEPAGGRMVAALTDGSRSVLGIVATCATAGVLVSVINLTGLGLTISSIIVQFGGGGRFMVIALAAIAMWVLGTAVPVTASYIIAAVMLVPALTKVGVPEPAAHMFMFYYAVLADVSPPTALAPFAAAAICGGGGFATTMQAWKYTLPAFLVPFLFCLTPSGLHLLMLTDSGNLPASIADWLRIGAGSLYASFGIIGITVGIGGYALGPVGTPSRILAGIGGGLLLTFDPAMEMVGLLLLGASLALHWFAPTQTAARG